MSQKLQDAP